MSNLVEYFNLNRYKPKYFLGDRIRATYKKIPISGTIGNDTLVSDVEGPVYSIHLDLPIKIDDLVVYFLRAKHSDIKNIRKPSIIEN